MHRCCFWSTAFSAVYRDLTLKISSLSHPEEFLLTSPPAHSPLPCFLPRYQPKTYTDLFKDFIDLEMIWGGLKMVSLKLLSSNVTTFNIVTINTTSYGISDLEILSSALPPLLGLCGYLNLFTIVLGFGQSESSTLHSLVTRQIKLLKHF